MKTDTVPDARRARGSAHRVRVVAATLILLVYYAVLAFNNRGIQLDDALIYLRYVDNLLSGHGLVYNEGIRFNGLTSPLFSFVLVVTSVVLGNPLTASFVLSVLTTFSAAICLWRVFAREVESGVLRLSPLYAWLGALLFLALPYFYFTYGMETGLFTFLSALLIYYAVTERYRVAGPLAALVFLTRSEGLALIAAIGVLHLWRHRRLPAWNWRVYPLPALMVLASFGFNYFYYGHLTAETGMAKVWQGRSGLWGEHLNNFLDVNYFYGWVFLADPVIFLFFAGSALLGAVALGRSYLNQILLLYLALYSAFYVSLNIPNYHWYYSPYFAIAPFYAAVGLGYAASRLRRGLGRARSFAITGICVAIAGYAIRHFTEYNSGPRGGMRNYRVLGETIARITPKRSVVAAVEIGTLGYYAHREIVDILGLVNPDNARYIGERDFDEWLKEYRVDYVVVHKPVWDHEVSFFTLGSQARLTEVCEAAYQETVLFEVERDREPGIVYCDGDVWTPGSTRGPTGGQAADPSAGFVDGVRLVGNMLRLRGWAVANEKPFDQLSFQGATAVMWHRSSRPDVAAHFRNPALEDVGFEATVAFETAEQARQASHGHCLGVTAKGRADDVHGIGLEPTTACQ